MHETDQPDDFDTDFVEQQLLASSYEAGLEELGNAEVIEDTTPIDPEDLEAELYQELAEMLGRVSVDPLHREVIESFEEEYGAKFALNDPPDEPPAAVPAYIIDPLLLR